MNELDQLLQEMSASPVPSIADIATRCDVVEEDLEVSLMNASVQRLEKAGDLLKLLREAGGLGTRELARKLKVEGSTISRMEQSENIETKTLARYTQQLEDIEVELVIKKGDTEVGRFSI